MDPSCVGFYVLTLKKPFLFIQVKHRQLLYNSADFSINQSFFLAPSWILSSFKMSSAKQTSSLFLNLCTPRFSQHGQIELDSWTKCYINWPRLVPDRVLILLWHLMSGASSAWISPSVLLFQAFKSKGHSTLLMALHNFSNLKFLTLLHFCHNNGR